MTMMEGESTISEPYLLSVANNTKLILNQPKFTIGRGLVNSHVIEDLQISRIHCTFEEKNGIWYITDQSSNGTLVNKVKIPPRIPQALSGGDFITLSVCSEFVFVYMRKDSLDNIDLSAVIDDAETTPIDCNKKIDTNQKISTSNELPGMTIGDPTTNNPVNIKDIEDTNPSNSNNENKIEPVASTSSTSDKHGNDLKQSSKSLEQQKTVIDPFEQVENELQCIICTELFIKATTLNCSHSFCKHCLEEWRAKKQNCPICRTKIITANPTIVLDNFIAKVLESASDEVKLKRKEIIKLREEQSSAKSTVPDSDRVLRSSVAPIELSSDDEDNYDEEEDENFESDDYDETNYNGIPGAYYGGYGHCFSCGDPGHWANGCPFFK